MVNYIEVRGLGLVEVEKGPGWYKKGLEGI
jgi:serine kinase of HPr protein (carbohydrate metabolism regulator)